MKLSLDQIKEILTTNPNRDLVKAGISYNKKMRMHLYGEGLEAEMTKIDDWERNSLHKLRVKYARSNKDLFSRLKRPIDKVFSARGGSVYYNLPEDQDRKARRLATNVSKGYSIRKWTEKFWMPHLLDDPFGVVFLELLRGGDSEKAKANGESIVYPTYKSISSIYDYLPNGSLVEYVVFNVSNREKKAAGVKEDAVVYRVVDDAYDYWVEVMGAGDERRVVILEQHTYKNWFERVPAILNSDIPDSQNEGRVVSFFDDVVELAQHFLMKGAIKLTHEFMHAYPKYWQYAEGCPDCNASGYDMKQEDQKCKSCRGTGKKISLSVSDVILLDFPITASDPTVAPNIGGYISPDKVYYEIATSDIKALEELMFDTVWGIRPKVAGAGTTVTQLQQKTATEVQSESKPQGDRLQVISEMAEKIHKFILDGVVVLNVTWNYGGSSVNYGRRYMVEGPDEIWRKYSEARVQGAPVSVLEDLLIEYYEAKYAADPIALNVAQKLMYVEPFVHHSVEQVKAFMAGEEDWKAKLYFSEWLSTQSEALVLVSTVPDLKASLKTFASSKQLQAPPEQKQLVN